MAGQYKEYLKRLVDSIVCQPDAFMIRCGDGKYIFSVGSDDRDTSDYFAISAIYDTICSIDASIKYAFSEVLLYEQLETFENHDPLLKPDGEEKRALYHTENIVFRISILWDLLAQLCNIIYHTGYEVDKLYYHSYFKKFSQGEQAFEIAKEVYKYFEENDDSDTGCNRWAGNHAFLKKYRNKLTHRVSPNISTMSSFGNEIRQPVIYILYRVIEDYHMASSFLCAVINQYLKEHENWLPFGLVNINGRYMT